VAHTLAHTHSPTWTAQNAATATKCYKCDQLCLIMKIEFVVVAKSLCEKLSSKVTICARSHSLPRVRGHGSGKGGRGHWGLSWTPDYIITLRSCCFRCFRCSRWCCLMLSTWLPSVCFHLIRFPGTQLFTGENHWRMQIVIKLK